MKRRSKKVNNLPPKNEESVPWAGLKPEPDKYFGFCYLVTNRVSGRKYIGKKQYWVAAGKASRRNTNRQSKQWKPHHWKQSDWEVYTGSSKDLNKDIHLMGLHNFDFEILSQHVSKSELHYAEIDWQVNSDCLRAKLEGGARAYYNKQIAGIKFLPPDYVSDETREKISNYLRTNGHPMQGRVHPNRGKALPQTAPKNHVSACNVQITNGTTNAWHPKDKPLPEGWFRGITTKGRKSTPESRRAAAKGNKALVTKARENYAKNPKLCKNCSSPIPYEKKMSWENCSASCRSEWRSKVSKRFWETSGRRPIPPKPKTIKSGNDHPMSDKTVYNWRNKKTGEHIKGTRQDMIRAYSLNPNSIVSMLKGRIKSSKGWELLKDKEND